MSKKKMIFFFFFLDYNHIFLSSLPFRWGRFHGFLVKRPDSVLDVTQFGFQVVAALLLLQEGRILQSTHTHTHTLNVCSSAGGGCCSRARTLFFS